VIYATRSPTLKLFGGAASALADPPFCVADVTADLAPAAGRMPIWMRMAEEGGDAADAPGSFGMWEEAWLAATAAAKRVVRPTKLFPMLSFCTQRRDTRNECQSRWKKKHDTCRTNASRKSKVLSEIYTGERIR
jgi:hypothetical protein